MCGIMISPGVGMIAVRFRGQGVASVPLRGELNRNNQLCGMWSLGFRGRCLLAQQGSWQILFPWLIGRLFMLWTAPLTEPGSKEVFSIHRRGVKQNKALSSAVLLIQISDPHLRMKLVPDRLLVLGGAAENRPGALLGWQVMDATSLSCAPCGLFQVFPVSGSVPSLPPYCPKSCRSTCRPRGLASEGEACRPPPM